MNINFKSDGGFSHFPGLNKPIDVNTDELSEEEAESLTKLVESASNESSRQFKPEIGSDKKKYTIVITDKGEKKTILMSDGESDSGLRNLLQYLLRKQKEGRQK